MSIRLTTGCPLSQNCLYFKLDNWYLVSGDLGYVMCQPPLTTKPWRNASTLLLRLKGKLWKLFQSNEPYWQWEDQHSPKGSCSLATFSFHMLSLPGTPICQHADELTWLHCSFSYLWIEEVRPLRPMPEWLIFENIRLSHSPWYLIQSHLCKAPSNFCSGPSTQ